MTNDGERRATERVPANCIVKYFPLPALANPLTTETLDLSEGGAALRVVQPLAVGEPMGLLLLTGERCVVEANARVIYSQPLGATLYRMGICFTAFAREGKSDLARETQHWTAPK